MTLQQNSILLDTSVIVRHFRDAEAVTARLAGYQALYVPVPALAELYYGAFRSDRSEWHLGQIDQFLAAVDVLVPDVETSQLYGKIAAQLSRRGTPIPQNDIWIAAIAIQHGLPLATTDRHFKEVDGIHLLLW